MKRIVFTLLTAIALISSVNSQSTHAQSATKNNPKEYIEVLYFHGKQRCITCNAIEKLTKEVITKDFAQQLKNRKVVFKVVDISTKEGEKIADKYEVTWSSLYINKWKEGKEAKNNMTDFGFSHAKGSPKVFTAGVKKKIDELLK